MSKQCCIKSCKIASDDPIALVHNLTFHRLPTREEVRKSWLTILQEHCPNIESKKCIHVCSRHFEKLCFHYPINSKRTLLLNWAVPSIFVPVTREQRLHPKKKQPESESNNLQDQNVNVADFPIMFGSTIPFIKLEHQYAKVPEDNVTDNIVPEINEQIILPDAKHVQLLKLFIQNQDISHSFQEMTTKIEKLERENKELKSQNSVLNMKLEQNTRRMDLFKKRNRDLTKQINNHKKRKVEWTVLKRDLRKQKELTEKANSILEGALPQENLNISSNPKSKKLQLSTFWRDFSSKLYTYSPKGYVFVRKTALKFLPHHRTIMKWKRKVSNPQVNSVSTENNQKDMQLQNNADAMMANTIQNT